MNFTLVELLIAIAIIAILAALLMPALNMAREKADTINCVSKQKNFAMATVQYAGDFDDRTMPVRTTIIAGQESASERNELQYWEGTKPLLGYGYLFRLKYLPTAGMPDMTQPLYADPGKTYDFRPKFARCGGGHESGWLALSWKTDYICLFDTGPNQTDPYYPSWGKKLGQSGRRVLGCCATSGLIFSASKSHGNGTTVNFTDGSAKAILKEQFLSIYFGASGSHNQASMKKMLDTLSKK